MIKDTYKTIKEISKGIYTERKSKFIAFAIPIKSSQCIKPELDKYRKEFYDARHICWAYMLGADRSEYRSNDDGEPSGTAGKPILGQINSYDLTNILVLVIRYFGGIKLGTSGLITSYRAATIKAISNSEIVEQTVDNDIYFSFEYPFMNDVMKVVKELDPIILNQKYDVDCHMALRIRASLFDQLIKRLKKIESLKFNN